MNKFFCWCLYAILKREKGIKGRKKNTQNGWIILFLLSLSCCCREEWKMLYFWFDENFSIFVCRLHMKDSHLGMFSMALLEPKYNHHHSQTIGCCTDFHLLLIFLFSHSLLCLISFPHAYVYSNSIQFVFRRPNAIFVNAFGSMKV